MQAFYRTMLMTAATLGVMGWLNVMSASPIHVTLRDGQIVPNEIDVDKGTTVQITVRNEGTQVHNFVIPDFYIFTQNLNPGESVDVSFVPDKTGHFRYYSDRQGIPEPGMQGTMTVDGEP